MDYHSESWFAGDSESDDDSDDFDPTFVNTRKRYKKLSEMEVCMKRHLDSRGDDSDTEDEVEKALVSPYKRLKLASLPSDSRLPDLVNKQPAKTMKVLQSQGQIKLAVYMNFGLLTVHVIQSRHLSSKWKSLCDSYVKMSLLPDESKRTRCKTQVVYDSNNPLYDEKFSFELLEEDHNKRLLISVWHRDQTSSLSEFLGCMSFGVRHLINPKKETTGWYYLLTEEIGRKKHLQVSKKKQQQQLKVRPHSNIPAINKDIWWMDPMTITVFRGKNGFGFSVIESCPVRIGRVDKASPAEEAGLKKGDCIVRVNGRNVSRSTADSVVKLVKHSRGKLVLDVQRSQEVCIEKMEKSPWRPSSSMTSINDENRAPIPYIDDVSEEWSDNGSQERQLSVDEDIILAEADFPTSTPLPLLCNAAKTVPSAERRKQEAIHRLMSIELDFIDFMYSGIERYSRPLRHCILNPKQHQDLFQNVEKLVTISEYHIKQMQDNAPSCSDTDTTSSQSSMDGTNHFVNSIGLIYQSKIQLLCQAYDIYARGLSNAKKVLTDLKRCQEFRKFIQDSEDPNQPSIMAFIYRAAQHIRELYHVLRDIFENTRPDSHDYHKLKLVVEGLQECVTNITNYSCTRTLNWGSVSSGISSNSAGSLRSSESSSSGSDYSDPRRLIKGPTPSLASYRSCDSKVMKIQERLKFQSNVEVFQLCDEDRRLVYSGEIYEWDGRAWIKLTVFLFTDILLLTECDRHGYYIVIQNPVFLRDIRGIHSEREHKTEFVMHVNSPRNPFSNCRVSFAEKHLFRAPTSELKFTWKSLIEQHIFAVRGSVEHFSSTNSINRSGGTVIV